jgi:hypothetical protein
MQMQHSLQMHPPHIGCGNTDTITMMRNFYRHCPPAAGRLASQGNNGYWRRLSVQLDDRPASMAAYWRCSSRRSSPSPPRPTHCPGSVAARGLACGARRQVRARLAWFAAGRRHGRRASHDRTEYIKLARTSHSRPIQVYN